MANLFFLFIVLLRYEQLQGIVNGQGLGVLSLKALYCTLHYESIP